MAKLLSFPTPMPSDAEFMAAVDLETSGNTAGAVKAYSQILERCECTRSAINLGTIYFNRKQFIMAEALYRRATQADPNYFLAFFNLANALDELMRRAEARIAYRTALRINPAYADAHYNLATALEQNGDQVAALKHWRAYLKLDNDSVYATHAANKIRMAVANSGLAKCVRAPGKNDRLSLSQKPLPDRHERGLVNGLTLLNSPERVAIDADSLGGFHQA